MQFHLRLMVIFYKRHSLQNHISGRPDRLHTTSRMDCIEFFFQHERIMLSGGERMLFKCKLPTGYSASASLLRGQPDHTNNNYNGIV